MKLADDTELMITEDEDDKKHNHKHASKGSSKPEPVSLSDSMAFTEHMADQSNGVHGFHAEKKPLSGQE